MTPEQVYFAQFSGEALLVSEIVIQTDEDMKAFNEMYHQKWADEHRAVINEWEKYEKQQGH